MVENLKLLRTSLGVSQQKLADEINVSQQSVNKYENHSVEPDIKTLIKIADYFNVSVDYLIGRSIIKKRAESLTMSDLNTNEENIINSFRQLSDKQQKLILDIIESYMN